MSFFKLKSIKKLTHFQKACKNLTKVLQSKFCKIKVRQTVKKITTFLVSSPQKLHIRPMRRRSTKNHHFHLLQRGSPAIFIDELYVPKLGQSSREPSTRKDKGSNVNTSSTNICTSGRNLKNDVATNNDVLLHQEKKGENMNKKVDWFYTRDTRGVDERAEDFISKVREDMRLQREQSILDFQEMLARSV